jgi:hypothetical protein
MQSLISLSNYNTVYIYIYVMWYVQQIISLIVNRAWCDHYYLIPTNTLDISLLVFSALGWSSLGDFLSVSFQILAVMSHPHNPLRGFHLFNTQCQCGPKKGRKLENALKVGLSIIMEELDLDYISSSIAYLKNH